MLEDLDREALVQILTKPKNAIITQYQKLFEFENVRLKFSDDALEAIADLAMERKVGARGLRMILEDLMLDLMYYLPSYKKVREFLVTKEMVLTQKISRYTIRKGGLDRARSYQSGGRTANRESEDQSRRFCITRTHAYFEGKIRYKTIADDAHPGRGHLSVHDDAVRGGPRIERAGAGRGAGRRQEDLSRHPARCHHR